MSIKDILPNPTFHTSGSLRIESDQDRFFGPGRLQLLEQIEQTGSINQAAKAMGMSYKKAWLMVASMNAQTTKPMVTTHTGGTQGGGAIVTQEAKLIITYYKSLRQRFEDFLQEESKKLYE